MSCGQKITWALMDATTVHCVSSAKDSNSADEKAIKESSSIALAKKEENPYLGSWSIEETEQGIQK